MVRTALFVNKQSGGMFAVEDMSLSTGNRFYVDSGASLASDTAGKGKNPDAPFATIDFAIGKCTASNGDIIFVMPGHAETIGAAGVDMDVAGVSVIGIGRGADRPTITQNATGSTFAINAASAYVENLLIITTAVVVKMVDVNATDCHFHKCEFRMETAALGIDVDGGSANTCDRFTMTDCVCDGQADGPNAFIFLNEIADDIYTGGNRIFGLFDDACIHNPTGFVLTYLQIVGNQLMNTSATAHAIELVSACTGFISNNIVNSPNASAGGLTAIDSGSCYPCENYGVDGTADKSGLINPAVDA